MKIVALGYIRPEWDFDSVGRLASILGSTNHCALASLIKAINDDIEYSKQKLDEEPNSEYRTDPFLVGDQKSRI